MSSIARTIPLKPTPRTRPLSQPELEELFTRWQHIGDHRARERLVQHFLPLARKLARRYAGANEPVDDLIQVASFGLLKAIDRFDAGRGFAFSSYAVPTIMGELKRYFRDTGWAVRVPRATQERAQVAEKAVTRLSAEKGRAPSPLEIALYLEWDVSEVLDALEAAGAHHAKSLDVPHSADEDSTLRELLGAEDERFDLIDARVSIASALAELPDRERDVLYLRFTHDLTQSEIAHRIGVSQMQVSRVLRRALTRLSEQADDRSRREGSQGYSPAPWGSAGE